MKKPPLTNTVVATTILAASILTAGISGAQAQSIEECDWVSSAANLMEPWEQNTRTFANGDVRIAAMDTIEPGAAAFHVLVLSPPYDEVGSRQCKVVSMSAGIGFSGLDFESLNARYDPAIGLTFTMGVQVYLPNTGGFAPRVVQFTLNQSTGEMQAGLQ